MLLSVAGVESAVIFGSIFVLELALFAAGDLVEGNRPNLGGVIAAAAPLLVALAITALGVRVWRRC